MPLHATPALPSYHPAPPATSALRWCAALLQRTETGPDKLNLEGAGIMSVCLVSDPRMQGAKGSPLRSRSTGTARDGGIFPEVLTVLLYLYGMYNT